MSKVSKFIGRTKSLSAVSNKLVKVQNMTSADVVKKFGSDYPGKTGKQIKGYIATQLVNIASSNTTSRKLNNFMTAGKNAESLGSMNRTTQKNISNIAKKVYKSEGKTFDNAFNYKPKGSKIDPIKLSTKAVFDRHKITVDSFNSMKDSINKLAKTKTQKERLMSARGSLGIVVNGEEVIPIESSKVLSITQNIKKGIQAMSPFTPNSNGNIRVNDPTYFNKLKRNATADHLEDLYGTEISTADSLFSEYASKDVNISDDTRRQVQGLMSTMSQEQKAYLGQLCRQNMYLFYEDSANLEYGDDHTLRYDGKLSQSKIMELAHKAHSANIERVIL